mmetsp:Transcript_12046/g.21179  ORF Transcript_12046/g.21179 Transcript_12046/m.21179 type:complete len:567 (+) Transcript_12046:88-1788(+)
MSSACASLLVVLPLFCLCFGSLTQSDSCPGSDMNSLIQTRPALKKTMLLPAKNRSAPWVESSLPSSWQDVQSAGSALQHVAVLAWQRIANSYTTYVLHTKRPYRERLFIGVLIMIGIMNLTVSLPLLFVFVRRRWCNMAVCFSERSKSSDDAGIQSKIIDEDAQPEWGVSRQPTIAALVPCFLPNEEKILEDTVNHILECLLSPGNLEVWVVYNTPKDMPEIEDRLVKLQERTDLPHGRTFKAMRVYDSKSKAENLNAALSQVTAPYVVLYDADHHPDPNSLLLLYDKLCRDSLDCAQGSVYIRNLCSGFLGRFIDAEFFVSHFLLFPAMKMYTQHAFFCGSNALWKRHVISNHGFDQNMQTEDIDVSIRVLLNRFRIDFCPEARSGELAPISLEALYKQRLRWAMGWDQVSMKYFRLVTDTSALPLPHCVSLIHILYTRWLLLIAGVFAGCGLPVLTLLFQSKQDMTLGYLEMSLSGNFFMIAACCILEALLQVHHRGRESAVQVFFVLFYLVFSAPCVLMQTVIVGVSLCNIASGKVGAWALTARSSDSKPLCTGDAKSEGLRM